MAPVQKESKGVGRGRKGRGKFPFPLNLPQAPPVSGRFRGRFDPPPRFFYAHFFCGLLSEFGHGAGSGKGVD